MWDFSFKQWIRNFCKFGYEYDGISSRDPSDQKMCGTKHTKQCQKQDTVEPATMNTSYK